MENQDAYLKTICKLVAELFNFGFYQFYTYVTCYDDALKSRLLALDIASIKNNLNRIKELSETTRFYEKAKLLRPILGMPSEEIQKMCEKMSDMYYR
jgi:hypothetical protein